jgi:hypothetical protein
MPRPRWRVVATINQPNSFIYAPEMPEASTYSNFHAFAADKLHAAHNVLLHLHKLRELLCEIRAELAGSLTTDSMA